jgi:hypothetical protein
VADYFLKLWNRGVDVGVNVETSLIVGLLGLLFWRGKLWLDKIAEKEKRLQQYEMDDKRARERDYQEAIAAHAGLRQAKANLCEAVRIAKSAHDLASAWEEFQGTFASRPEIRSIPGNIGLAQNFQFWAQTLRANATRCDLEGERASMLEIIANCRLPEDPSLLPSA